MARFAIASSAITGEAARLDELLVSDIRQVELGFFAPGDETVLRSFLAGQSLGLSIHEPLIKDASFAWPRFTGPDEKGRLDSLRQVERSLPAAAEWGAEYVVTHLPTSMLAGVPEQSEIQAWDMARRSGEALAEMGRRYGVPILVENVGPNAHFQTAAHYRQFLTDFPSLGFCLDIGHLHLLHLRTGIDPLEFAADLAPVTASVHIYAARLPEYREYRHVPAHPSLRPQDGWSDVLGILRAVLAGNPDCLLVFEHNLFYPGSEGLAREGVAWVQATVAEWERARLGAR